MGIKLIYADNIIDTKKDKDAKIMGIYLGEDCILSDYYDNNDPNSFVVSNAYNYKYIDHIIDYINENNVNIIKIHGNDRYMSFAEGKYINNMLELTTAIRKECTDKVIVLASRCSYIDLLTRDTDKDSEIIISKILDNIDYMYYLNYTYNNKRIVDIKGMRKANIINDIEKLRKNITCRSTTSSEFHDEEKEAKPCIHGNLCRKYFDRYHVIYSTLCPKCDMYVPKES